jgi:hypothetical protein
MNACDREITLSVQKGYVYSMTFFSSKKRIFFAPLLGMCFLASFWLTPGTAFAATMSSSVSNHNNCSAMETPHDVVIATDGGWNVDCFSGSGTESVGLSTVVALETNYYNLNYTWVDWNGNTHNSRKGAGTLLAVGNTDGTAYFAGSESMEKITSITLIPVSSISANSAGCTNSPVPAFFATEVPYSVWCLDDVQIAGDQDILIPNVYAIWSGGYAIVFNWDDENGNTHYNSTLPPYSFLAAGNANNSRGPGFAGSNTLWIIGMSLTA